MSTASELSNVIADLQRPELPPAMLAALAASREARDNHDKIIKTIRECQQQLEDTTARKQALCQKIGAENAVSLVFGKSSKKLEQDEAESARLTQEIEKLEATLSALSQLKEEQITAIIEATRKLRTTRRDMWLKNVDQLQAVLQEQANQVQGTLVLARLLDKFCDREVMTHRFREANLTSLTNMHDNLIGASRADQDTRRGVHETDPYPLASAWHKLTESLHNEMHRLMDLSEDLSAKRRAELEAADMAAQREAYRKQRNLPA